MNRAWPPLIVASRQPAWMRRRDFLLTLAMWLLFAIMLETEFELFFGPYLERLGWGDFDTDAAWTVFFGRLRPFVIVTAALVTWLVVSGVFTLQRRRRTLLGDPPPPLSLEEQAARAGMDPFVLKAARDLPNAVVSAEPDGSRTVKRRDA
jgi:hypothetical protein